VTEPIERDFPNIERLLAGLLADVLGGEEHAGSKTPDNLEEVLPFARVFRSGGPRTHLFDYPIVEIDYLAADEASGAPGASALANLLLAKPPPHPSIDLVTCEPHFHEVPWGDNENVRCWTATFFFETRMVRVPALP
jgi:hypothetical protein